MKMAKMIEKIEKLDSETAEETAGKYMDWASEHSEDLKALFDLLEVANRSGMITLLKSLFENKGSAMDDVSEELTKPQNMRFVRNLMSIYTLLSNIDPDIVRSFMLNLARAVDRSGDMKGDGPLGLLAIRSKMKDPDVTVGMRVLFEVARGFTRETGRKE